MYTRKICFSVILTFIYLFAMRLYHSFQGSLESQVAVKQIEDSSFSYGVANFVTNSNFSSIILIIFLWAIGSIWLGTIINLIKKQFSKEKNA